MYIYRGHRLQFPENVVFFSLKIDVVLANSADPDEMPPYAAFLWVFTVCQRTCLGVSGLQMVIHISSKVVMYVGKGCEIWLRCLQS